MSRRPILLLIAVLSAGLLLGACNRMVRVETGERIVCTYGEVTTDTIHTVEVPAADAVKYKAVRTTVICARHQQLEALYATAQDAIDSGDLAAARAKLAEVVKIEPLFKNAQQQIDRIGAGGKPVVDRSTPTPTKDPTSANKPGKTSAPTDMIAPPAKQPVGPVASLSVWIPDVLPGYTAMPIVSGAQTLTANGRSVWFGTDGKRLAVAAWNEGGILVVVEGSSKEGKPAALKSHLTSLVMAITG